jgi:3-phenylpropionate/cinnamic acid dioxygenase small subunit
MNAITELSDRAAPAGRRVSASEPRHGEVVDFLVAEAYLLDDDRHIEWLDLLTDDIAYVSMLRKTLYRHQGSGIVPGGEFNDSKATLLRRAKRNVEVPSAYDRDPAPRICRMVSNVVVHETANADELDVRSRLLLLRNRFDDPAYDMLSAQRRDVLRRTETGLRLARRTITPDAARFSTQFPNVFL